ncbi:MAG: ATPase [Alphaproteobacteria bacterium]|nr:ATPase [Alphaproteobacteria bacterium]
MKRFYKSVAVTGETGAYAVALDGKGILTPARLALSVPGRALAEAIAREWDGQGEEIDPAAMPLTRLANTAIDRVEGRRAAVIHEIAAYAASDLVCYRADAPADLAGRQAESWQPLVDWMGAALGAPLNVTTGITAVPQPEDSMRAVTVAVARHRTFPLTALHAATVTTGSVVVALALGAGRIDAETAWRAAMVDELFQAARWGDDPEIERRHASIRAEIATAALLFALCAEEPGP